MLISTFIIPCCFLSPGYGLLGVTLLPSQRQFYLLNSGRLLYRGIPLESSFQNGNEANDIDCVRGMIFMIVIFIRTFAKYEYYIYEFSNRLLPLIKEYGNVF